MNSEQHLKVTASHLGRLAYLYVRQSTLRQVLENTESTKRQYALKDRAMALGWPADRVVVIDPVTNSIVWQYGLTDTPGTLPGLLSIPDGFDLLARNGSTPTHPQTG